jgi:PAS domain S-box-containing protein
MRWLFCKFYCHYLLKLLITTVIYTFSSRTLLNYFAPDGSVSIFFIASGVGLATVLIGGKRYAPSILFGSTISNCLGGLPFLTALSMGTGSTLGALLAAYWLKQNKSFDLSLSKLSDWLLLMLLGGFVGCAVNAIAGVTALFMSDIVSQQRYFDKILSWWMGDTMGVIVIAPFALTWWQAKNSTLEIKQTFEALLLLMLTFLVSTVVFLGWLNNYLVQISHAYWLFLCITWIAIRLEIYWMTLAILIVAIVGLQGVYGGAGIFYTQFTAYKALNYWSYIVVLSIVGIALSTYISTHRRIEASLRLSSEMMSNMAEGVVLTRASDGIILHVNKQFEQMFGYEPGELLKQHISIVNASTEATAVEVANSIITALKQSGVWRGEVHNIKKDGTDFWCYANVSTFIHPEFGQVWLSIHIDITARKQVEQQLCTLSVAIEQSPASVVIADLDANLIYVNPGFTQATGYSAEEVMGQNPRLLQSGLTAKATYEEMWKALTQGEVWHGELVNQRKNGEVYWEEAHIAPVKNSAGAIINYVGVKIEITQRKQAEQKLRESEERLNLSQEYGGIGSWEADLINNRQVWSTSAYKLIGSPVIPEPRWEDFLALVHPEDRQKVIDASQAHLKQGRKYEVEYRVVLKSGEIRWMRSAGKAQFASDGTPTKFIGIVQDISDRKFLEDKLQFLFNFSPIGFALNEFATGHFIEVNEAMYASSGYSKEEFLALSYWDLTPREYEAQEQRQLESLRTLKRYGPYEKEYIRKDGSRYPVVLNGVLMRDVDGKEYIWSIVENITERKQAEQQLRELNRDFVTFLESTSDFIYFKDENSRIRFCSQTLADITYHKNWRDLIGKHDFEIFPADTAQIYYQEELLVFERGQPLLNKTDLYYKEDGSQGWVNTNKWPVFDDNRRVVGIFGISRDITELKRTEIELEQLSELQQILTEIASTYINLPVEALNVTVQASLKKLGEFVNADRAYIFAYDFAKQIAINTYEWCAEGVTSQIQELQEVPLASVPDWVKAHLNGQAIYVPDVLSLPMGGLRDILEAQDIQSLLAEPLMHSKHCLGFVGFDSVRQHRIYSENEMRLLTVFAQMLVNVEQRKQAEVALYQAKEAAEAANQAKSEFLANMSHEIRTPMNAILGFSDILKDLISDKVQNYYLDAIKTSGKILLQLINDILDLSKIEAGKLELNYSPVAINSILDDISVVFSQKIAEKGLRFSLEVCEIVPPYLLLDEVRLRQILLNMVGNAVKFTDKGFIRIAVTIQPGSSEQYINLSLAIEDSGMGIAQDQIDVIFQAFTQQKQQSVRYGGTGLGLTICKRLVEIMGGNITVQSTVGQGSCFTVNLQNVEICQMLNNSTFVEKPILLTEKHFQPAKVLVVDDVEANRQLIKSYLNDYSELQLIEAGTGEEALDLVLQQHFDLILMDRRLPGDDGDTVCGKIRALPDYTSTPIIMITASALLRTEEQPQPAFYNLQLNKPVNKTELLAAMQSFLTVAENLSVEVQPESVAIMNTDTDETKSVAELIELLTSHYQGQIAYFHNADALEIDAIIELAIQLLEVAQQYHCQVLYEWAQTLKNQAELFELESLPKTLVGFQMLLEKLSNIAASL